MVNLTDNDIIKALECCTMLSVKACSECPYHEYYSIKCFIKRNEDIVDLINRQKARIEELNVELVGMRGACESYKMHYDNAKAEIERLRKETKLTIDSIRKLAVESIEDAKSEAIKEFAERLKKEADNYDLCHDGVTYAMVDVEDIDNLVKEMKERF